ncbi:phosphatidate cytidylyltransferase [Geothermobacter ehrlichii]|uniref:Phosphatidate cytidylyltransferase n=2 Tax=Geothermobacter ehrlichii TaxID=213224 RepID=A0A5D3WPB2_9BACT|nr:phosphatidate cytidylyltransferase [Geothermobacter ehrlichii]
MAQGASLAAANLVAVVGGSLFVLLAGLQLYVWSLLALTLLSFLLFSLFLFQRRDLRQIAHDCAVTLMGVVYLAFPLALMVELFRQPNGRQWIFFVLLTVMLSDTCAYFVGSRWGRKPLYPSVSPNKSVEGAVGGLLGALVGGGVAVATFFPSLGLLALPVALFLSVCGQVGDLFESLLKRSFGVKDSGTMIPGHGGLLDRLDSLLFAFPGALFCALTGSALGVW